MKQLSTNRVILGFIGLGLYVAILVLAFVNCSKIRKMTRGKEEFAWAFDLAGMIQLSLFAFCVAGAALSMAYYDVFFILVGLLPAMLTSLKSSIAGQLAPANKLTVPALNSA